MSQLLDSHVTDLLRISSQYALGPKPVLVLLGLCGSHWQKVLIGKDPVDKGMQYSRLRRWHGHQQGDCFVKQFRGVASVLLLVACERAAKGHY